MRIQNPVALTEQNNRFDLAWMICVFHSKNAFFVHVTDLYDEFLQHSFDFSINL